jgi:hypothetical protein
MAGDRDVRSHDQMTLVVLLIVVDELDRRKRSDDVRTQARVTLRKLMSSSPTPPTAFPSPTASQGEAPARCAGARDAHRRRFGDRRPGAHAGALERATISNKRGIALCTDWLKLDGGAFLKGLTAIGEVRAAGAHITGPALLHAGHPHQPGQCRAAPGWGCAWRRRTPQARYSLRESSRVYATSSRRRAAERAFSRASRSASAATRSR